MGVIVIVFKVCSHLLKLL